MCCLGVRSTLKLNQSLLFSASNEIVFTSIQYVSQVIQHVVKENRCHGMSIHCFVAVIHYCESSRTALQQCARDGAKSLGKRGTGATVSLRKRYFLSVVSIFLVSGSLSSCDPYVCRHSALEQITEPLGQFLVILPFLIFHIDARFISFIQSRLACVFCKRWQRTSARLVCASSGQIVVRCCCGRRRDRAIGKRSILAPSSTRSRVPLVARSASSSEFWWRRR